MWQVQAGEVGEVVDEAVAVDEVEVEEAEEGAAEEADDSLTR